jgi:hypothetical protein
VIEHGADGQIALDDRYSAGIDLLTDFRAPHSRLDAGKELTSFFLTDGFEQHRAP